MRSTLTRVTFDRHAGGPAIWTRDGGSIVSDFLDVDGGVNLARQSLTGNKKPVHLSPTINTPYAGSFTPNGEWLVFEEVDPTSKLDLRLLSLSSGMTTVLLQTPFNEQNAEIAPDGRWLAYQSDESGRGEVYVRPFPDVNTGRWQVSAAGGTRPVWSRDGRELFYLDAERRLTVVAVRANPQFAARPPRTLFDTRPFGLEGIGRNFDVSPDSMRFLLVKNLPTPPDAKRLIVVENWFEELKPRVPTE
jgi:serine/threonine-protein kinase